MLILQVGRISICHHPVAIPLDESYPGICGQHAVDYVVYKFLHFGVSEVEHQLVPEIMFGTVRQFQDPVGMCLIKFAFRINHFRFYPYPEFHSPGISLLYKIAQSVWKLCLVFLPVAKACPVVVSWVFICKPAVVEKEDVETHFFRIVEY